jgi:hypothetical protein
LVVEQLFEFPTKLPPEVLAIGGLFDASIGILFGCYPAIKASQLDPIQGLCYDFLTITPVLPISDRIVVFTACHVPWLSRASQLGPTNFHKARSTVLSKLTDGAPSSPAKSREALTEVFFCEQILQSLTS